MIKVVSLVKFEHHGNFPELIVKPLLHYALGLSFDKVVSKRARKR